MGAVADALKCSVEMAGVVVCTSASVARVIVEGDRVVGVTLANGENLRTGLVIAAIDPRTTFQKRVGPQHLDAGFFKRMHYIRLRNGAANLLLALKDTPDFRGADQKSRLGIAPSIRAVEDSFNAVKYGEVPLHPVLEAVLLSAHEAGFAVEGCHTLSATLQFTPHDPKAGKTPPAHRCWKTRMRCWNPMRPAFWA